MLQSQYFNASFLSEEIMMLSSKEQEAFNLTCPHTETALVLRCVRALHIHCYNKFFIWGSLFKLINRRISML